MVTASQTVTIERHEWEGGLVALTFADPAQTKKDGNSPPLVFVLHGLGSRKERHLDLCLRLARAGFCACAVDARHHGERQTPDSEQLFGNRESLAFLQAFGEVVLGTVEEMRQIADALGATRYGVVGHSMGGFMALIAALSDDRTAAIVNVAGSLINEIPATILETMPPTLREMAKLLDVSERAEAFWPTAVLLVHGTEDTSVPVAGARRLHQALLPHYADDPQRLQLTELAGVGHEFTADAAEQAVAFLRSYLL